MSEQNRLNDPVSDVKWVHRQIVRPNTYNPNNVPDPELRLLCRSILEDGWTQPIVVRPAEPEDDMDDEITYIVVDGENRWAVSGQDEIRERYDGRVPIVVVTSGEADRRISTIRHNRARGQHQVDSMGAIVAELIQEGLSKEEIKSRLEMSEEEVNRLANRAGVSALYEDREYSTAWAPADDQ